MPDKKPEYYTANPYIYVHLKDKRDVLKKEPTYSECVLWAYLKNKGTGYKIRRQHVIDKYVVDFVCLPKKLVIEVDGDIHLTQKERDEARTADLNLLGYKVIRFTNEEVCTNAVGVTQAIKEELDRL